MQKNFKHFLKIATISAVIIFSFFVFNISHASAATLYFTNSINQDWNTLGNWWTDSGFSVPAGSLPGVGDDVITEMTILSNSGPAASVNTFTMPGESSYPYIQITITVANGATLSGTAYLSNNGGGVGTIIGNAVFNNDAVDNGAVVGNATFNTGARLENYGTVSGNATFNDNSRISSGTAEVGGNATFNDISFNCGIVAGTATFNYAHAGVITIADEGMWCSGTAGATVGDDTLPITSWIFNGNSVNDEGEITGDATFNDSSYNMGEITGDATFNDFSYNSGSVAGDAYFNDDAYNDGEVDGDLITLFTSNAISDRNFISGGPYLVIADGAIVNIYNATYDGTTIFQTLNGGSFDNTETFVGYESGDTLVTPDSPGEIGSIYDLNTTLALGGENWWTDFSEEEEYDSQVFKIKSNLEDVSIPKIIINWSGYGEADRSISLSIWNFNTSSWEELDSNICADDCALTGEKIGNKYKDNSDFVWIWVKVYNVHTDYIGLSIEEGAVQSSGGGGGGGGPSIKTIPAPDTSNITDCLPTFKFSPSTGKPCVGTTPLNPAIPNPPTSCFITTILKQGSRGEEVKCLQTKLIVLQNSVYISADGVFGPKTKLAVMNFQRLHNLTPDGVVGPKTRSELNKQ